VGAAAPLDLLSTSGESLSQLRTSDCQWGTPGESPTDRRAWVHLTERARAAEDAVQSAWADLERHVTATLTEIERTHLIAALRKVNAQLDVLGEPAIRGPELLLDLGAR
jgi:hypothetical protein